jgi:hypothetical protein
MKKCNVQGIRQVDLKSFIFLSPKIQFLKTANYFIRRLKLLVLFRISGQAIILINTRIGVPPTERRGVSVLRACVSYKGLN